MTLNCRVKVSCLTRTLARSQILCRRPWLGQTVVSSTQPSQKVQKVVTKSQRKKKKKSRATSAVAMRGITIVQAIAGVNTSLYKFCTTTNVRMQWCPRFQLPHPVQPAMVQSGATRCECRWLKMLALRAV